MSDPSRAVALLQRAREAHTPSSWLMPAAAICLTVGVLGFLFGLSAAPQWAWGAFLVNFLFWAGLCQAAVAVTAVFTIAPARWGRIFQRMGNGLAAFLPFTLPALLVIWFGRCHLVAALCRSDDNPWLHSNALFLRDAGTLIVLGGLSLWFVFLSLRPDLGAWGGTGPDTRLRRWVTRRWRGLEAERTESDHRMRLLAPALVIGYVFGYSLLAIDLSMALDPAFRSTMYPGIYCIGEFYAALAALAVLAWAWCRRSSIAGLITPAQSLDLGNLMWGFAIFWAYVAWAQYAVIWYGNLPEEATHIIRRYRTQPWDTLSWIALLLTFIVPFLLLFNRPLKRSTPALALPAVLGILGGGTELSR